MTAPGPSPGSGKPPGRIASSRTSCPPRPARFTLSTSVQVAGDYDPVPAEPAATTSVNGFDVSVEGDLVAGSTSELTMTITRETASRSPHWSLTWAPSATSPCATATSPTCTSTRTAMHHRPARPPARRSCSRPPHRPRADTCCTWTSRSTNRFDTAPLVIDTTGAGDNGGHSGGEHSDTEPDTGDKHEEGADHRPLTRPPATPAARGGDRVADRRHDLRLVREPNREEAQQARRRHRVGELRDGERPASPAPTSTRPR